MKQALLFLVCSIPFAANAADLPQPGKLDPRIQTIKYDADQVVLLRGTLGYQFMLELGRQEHIETVSVGDAVHWQITPNRRANVLFIKPVSQGANTDLTILTGDRRYVFELGMEPREQIDPILYVARMVYPQEAPSAPEIARPDSESLPRVSNSAYLLKGADSLRPVRVFDDGSLTYFEWEKDKSVPAIFAVAEDGHESLVNYSVKGLYIVVDQVAPSFRLRNGMEVGTVENRGVMFVRKSPRW